MNKPSKQPSIATLNDMIYKLRLIFESDQVDIEQVKQLMKSYQSNPAQWIKYALCDPDKYTRNLVDSGNEKYNLMMLCWPPSMKSRIHDHSDSHCIMKILAGNLYEIQYSWPEFNSEKETNLKQINETRLDQENNVAYINDSIGLHRVENRDDNCYAISLHLYCPPFKTCKTFDEKTGNNQTVNVTFDTEHIQPKYRVSHRKISTIGVNDKDMLIFEESNTSQHKRVEVAKLR